MTKNKVFSFIVFFLSIAVLGQIKEKEYGFFQDRLTNINNVIYVYDNEAGTPNQQDDYVYSYVKLFINNNELPFSWYNLTVELSITVLQSDGTVDPNNTNIPYSLSVNYNPNSTLSGTGTHFNDTNYLKIENGYGLSVTVISYTVTDIPTNTTATYSPENAYIEVGFMAERYYLITQQTPISDHTVTHYTDLGGTKPAELKIQWEEVTGAVEYELEWTWIDNYHQDASSILLPEQISLSERDFERNNTRIVTTKKEYNIPLIYAKGYLIYRVRGISRFINHSDTRFYGPWSSGSSTKITVADWPHYYQIQLEHEKAKNWQFQASYAEEGKKKEVVSYFDGSLRNRQTVTKVNTDNNAIIGEVIYDFQGRPAVEVLPTPVNDENIRFFNNYNSNGTEHYSFLDFDLDNEQESCSTLLSGMSNLTGSSRYYSSNNDFFNRKNHNFIPDAKNFPFSQIEYTPDNTGRILRKGGVGIGHQLDSGHEMKYFYTVPNDVELNRLFGYSVGDVSHYKKNIVVDPNEQVSVSYIDPQGRTIATALAGGHPSALDGLNDETQIVIDSNTPEHGNITVDLLNNLHPQHYNTPATGYSHEDNNILQYSGNFSVNNDILVFSKEIGVAGNSIPHSFSYQLSQETTFESCNTNYPFVYDLQLSLKDICGQEIAGFEGVNQTVGTTSIGSVTNITLNHNPTGFNLDTGAYSIYKKLKVNQEALNSYADDYIEKLKTEGSGCYVDPDTFSPNIDIDLCNLTCETCFERIGLLEDYVQESLIAYYNNNTFVAEPTTSGSVEVTYNDLENDINLLQNIDTAELNALIVRFVREWELLEEQCNSICTELNFVTSCEVSRNILMADLYPYGQYGAMEYIEDVDDPENQVLNPDFILSVFNENGVLFNTNDHTVTGNHWKNTNIIYKDEYGNEAFIEVVNNGTALLPDYDLEFTGTTTTITDPITGLLKEIIHPQQLVNVSDFISKWSNSFAEALLPFHPEYQYLLYNEVLCEYKKEITIPHPNGTSPDITLNLASGSFDELLIETTTYQQAFDRGLVNFSNTTYVAQILSKDPYFQSGALSLETLTQRDQRYAIMYHALVDDYAQSGGDNVFEMAVRLTNCSSIGTCDISNILSNFNSLSSVKKDAVWNMYKNLYISLKGKIQHVFSNLYALEHNGYNGCIGGSASTSVTNVLTDNFTQKNTIYTYIQSLSQSNSLCNSSSGTYYIEKIKRFVASDSGYDSGIDANDAANQLATANNYEYYAQTGNCPLLFDMDLLLNGFFRDINYHTLPLIATNLNSNTDFTGNYLSKDFFIEAAGLSLSQSQHNVFLVDNPKISTSVSGQTLTLNFSGGWNNNTVNTCATTVTIETNTYGCTWNNYVYTSVTTGEWSIFNIKQFYYDQNASNLSGGVFAYQAIAEILIAGELKEILLSGTTCVAIGECGITDNGIGQVLDPNSGTSESGNGCTVKHDFTQAFVVFLNELKANNQLNSTTNVDLNNYASYKNSFLATFFSEDVSTTLNTVWIKGGTGYNIIKNGTIVFNFNINLTGMSGSSFTGAYFYEENGTQHLKLYATNSSGSIVSYSGNSRVKLDFSCCPLINECEKKHVAFLFDVPVVGKIINNTLRLKIGTGVKNFLVEHIDYANDPDLSNKLYYTTATYGLDNPYSSFSFSDVVKLEDPNTDTDINNFNVVNDGGLIRTFNTQTSQYTDKFVIQNMVYNDASTGAGIGNISSFTNGMYQNPNQSRKTDVLFYLIGDSSEGDNISPGNLINYFLNNAQRAKRVFFIFFVNSSGNLTSGDYTTPSSYMNFILNGVSGLNPESYTGLNSSSANYMVIQEGQFGSADTILQETFNAILDATPIFTDCDAVGCYMCRETNKDKDSPTNPCNTCIPQTVAPVVCDATVKNTFLSFLDLDTNGNSQTIMGYSVEEGEFDDFCESNYQYIAASYQYYITTMFDLNTSGTASSYDIRFRTIAQFGATYLNYGFAQINDVIEAYKSYYDANASDPEVKNWNNWVNEDCRTLLESRGICPPAAMLAETPDLPELIPACGDMVTNLNEAYSAENYNNFLQEKRKEFIRDYIALGLSTVSEQFHMTYFDKEYQYTLYYYDQAGNLTQTVAPEGVKRFTPSDLTAKNDDINEYRAGYDMDTTAENATLQPDHSFKTQYHYNSLNQLVWQSTPDGGISRFAYDKLGRIIASQNAKQLAALTNEGVARMSYTVYDALGRITEAGEVSGIIALDGTTLLSYYISENGKLIKVTSDAVDDGNGNITYTITEEEMDGFQSGLTKIEITRTVYDTNPEVETGVYSNQYFTTLAGVDVQQRNFNNRNRVTGIFYYDQYIESKPLGFNNAIFYNYDVHGNVKEQVTYFAPLRDANCDSNLILDASTGLTNDCEAHLKRVVYDYDLISGNVNQVTLQPGKADQFIHRYEYDADNRIVNVQTSADGVIWEKDAQYEYYAHGPLSRVELGDKMVQGTDYAYTLQGWLKAVNGENLASPVNDMGADGTAANILKTKDAFGYSLNYFNGDYKAVDASDDESTNFKPLMFSRNSLLGASNRNLYNGNIKQMTTAIRSNEETLLEVQKNSYTYDQLNRITGMTSVALIPNASGVQSSVLNSYSSSYSYDRNGNLKTLNRNLQDGEKMDQLSYKYWPGNSQKQKNNQLTLVKDAVQTLNNTQDLEDQEHTLGIIFADTDVNTHNYIYDEIGQLIGDKTEGLYIQWRADGKVRSIVMNSVIIGKEITFVYDGLGNRIGKTVTTSSRGGITSNTTYYARDAQGNVLGVYNFYNYKSGLNTTKSLTLQEHDIYGSSRVGLEEKDLKVYQSSSGKVVILLKTAAASTTSKLNIAGNSLVLNANNEYVWPGHVVQYNNLTMSSNLYNKLLSTFRLSTNALCTITTPTSGSNKAFLGEFQEMRMQGIKQRFTCGGTYTNHTIGNFVSFNTIKAEALKNTSGSYALRFTVTLDNNYLENEICPYTLSTAMQAQVDDLKGLTVHTFETGYVFSASQLEEGQGLDLSFVYGGATNSTLTLGNTSTVLLAVSTTTGD
ncbi:DUF6443 domain-containing protein, partial [Flavobacterium sp. U410]